MPWCSGSGGEKTIIPLRPLFALEVYLRDGRRCISCGSWFLDDSATSVGCSVWVGVNVAQPIQNLSLHV